MYKQVENWIKSVIKNRYYIILGDTISNECSLLGVKYNNLSELYNKYYIMYMELINKYDNVVYYFSLA